MSITLYFRTFYFLFLCTDPCLCPNSFCKDCTMPLSGKFRPCWFIGCAFYFCLFVFVCFSKASAGQRHRPVYWKLMSQCLVGDRIVTICRVPEGIFGNMGTGTLPSELLFTVGFDFKSPENILGLSVCIADKCRKWRRIRACDSCNDWGVFSSMCCPARPQCTTVLVPPAGLVLLRQSRRHHSVSSKCRRSVK